MSFLQNIKGVFNDIFPLHLNSAMEDLEEDLADSELELYFSKAREESLREDREALVFTNGEYLAENARLVGRTIQADRHIDFLNKELDKLYRDLTPNFSFNPDVSTCVQNSILHVRLAPLSLAHWMPSDVPVYARERVAKNISKDLAHYAAKAVEKESYATILESLNKE